MMALPSLKSLRSAYPKDEIWLAAYPGIKELYDSFSLINGCFTVPEKGSFHNIKKISRFIKQQRFDIGILLTNSFSSALIFYLAGIPERWGYAKDGRRFLLTKPSRPPRRELPLHQVEYYQELLYQMGIPQTKEGLSIGNDWVFKQDYAMPAELKLRSNNPLILLHPGASYGPAKRWPAAYYSQLADLLQEQTKAQVAITGSSEDQPLAEKIRQPLNRKPVSLCGKTSLPALINIIRKASLFITNDTGPMHIANALKIPVVALFGPTDPRVTGPYQSPAVVLKKDVVCWPCQYRVCPFDHRCLVSISPEEVYKACREFI